MGKKGKKGKKGSKKKKGKGGPAADATYGEWLTHIHEERKAAGKWIHNGPVIADVLKTDEPIRHHLLKVPEGGPQIIKDEKVYSTVKAKSALSRKVVIFYFASMNQDIVNDESLTPHLIDLHQNAIESGKKVEVVYVPMDVKQEQFEEFFETMPWLSLPMGDPQVKHLCAKYRVSIPPKIVVVAQNGHMVTDDGVKKLIQQPNNYPWTKAASLDPVETAQKRPNNLPCFIPDAKCKKYEGGTLSKQYETDLDRENEIKIPGVCGGCGCADIYHIPVKEEEGEEKGKGKKGSKKKKKK